MDIVIEPQVSDSIKAASIVKNKVEKSWAPLIFSQPTIDDSERSMFKEHLIPALVKVPTNCRPVLVKVLNIIVAQEFAQKWCGPVLEMTLSKQATLTQHVRACLVC